MIQLVTQEYLSRDIYFVIDLGAKTRSLWDYSKIKAIETACAWGCRDSLDDRVLMYDVHTRKVLSTHDSLQDLRDYYAEYFI